VKKQIANNVLEFDAIGVAGRNIYSRVKTQIDITSDSKPTDDYVYITDKNLDY